MTNVSPCHMGRTLKVQLENPSPDLVHDFRNFGEDVYREFRDKSVSIDEIDASTSTFHLRDIPKREVRTVASKVRELVEKYRSLIVSVDEIKESGNG